MPSSDGPPLDERSLLTVTSLGHAICHVGELVFIGVMLAVQKEFALESWQAAALAGPGYLLMGVGALPVGVLADWWGPTRVFQLYFVGMAVGGLLVAVSTTVWQLLAALTFLGLAASIYHPVGLALLSLGTGSRGRAMGINGVAGSIGVACGPLLGAAFAAMGQWRLAFVALAVLSLITGAYLLLVQRRINVVTLTPRHRPEPASARPFDWRRSLPMILVSATMLLGGFNYRCLLTALPVYLGGEAAGEVFRGGVTMFLVLLVGGCVGQYLGGWAVDRFGAVVYPVFTALLVPLALLLAAFSGWGVAALLAGFYALGQFAQQPVENALLADWTPRGRRGLSYGTKVALTFGVGSLGSLATGAVWEATGTPAPIFYILAGTALAMCVLFTAGLVLRRRLAAGATEPSPVVLAESPVAS